MAKKGVRQTEEHKKKISLAQKGKPRPQTTGEKNGMWKGEKSKYAAIHMWVRAHKGNPNICEYCGDESLRDNQYQWANIDHKYLRNLADYIRLCAKCHQKYDIENNGYIRKCDTRI